jgi:uncharacterized repeat protein (TIGR02543 family)
LAALFVAAVALLSALTLVPAAGADLAGAAFTKATGTWTATACCAHSGNEASKAIDGSVTTFWDYGYGDGSGNSAMASVHWFQIDLGASRNVSRVTYVPRPVAGGYNGNIMKYEIYVHSASMASAGGHLTNPPSSGTLAARGEWRLDEMEYPAQSTQYATFSTTAGRYVLIRVVEAGINDDNPENRYVNAAEFSVFTSTDFTYDSSALSEALTSARSRLASLPVYQQPDLQAAISKAEAWIDPASNNTIDVRFDVDPGFAHGPAGIGKLSQEQVNYLAALLDSDGAYLTSWQPTRMWLDNNGRHIQAHGGGVMYDPVSQRYWWYGEDKYYSSMPSRGVHAYSSSDLYNWIDEGVALHTFNNTNFETWTSTGDQPQPENTSGPANAAAGTWEAAIRSTTDASLQNASGPSTLYVAEDNAYADINVTTAHETTNTYTAIRHNFTSAQVGELNALYANVSVGKRKQLYAFFNHLNILERPKVIYHPGAVTVDGITFGSASGGYYVCWFHNEGRYPDGGYGNARAAVAVADSPAGPFKLLGSYRVGWRNGEHPSSLGMARDLGLFRDAGTGIADAGDAYLLVSSEENATMISTKLSADYLTLAVSGDQGSVNYNSNWARFFVGDSREAPAPFKYNGTYYILSSTTSGWRANRADISGASAMVGANANFDTTTSSAKTPAAGGNGLSRYPFAFLYPDSVSAEAYTFGGQSTFVLNVVNRATGQPYADRFIAMFDIWHANDSGRSDKLRDSRYVWLPMEVKAKNGQPFTVTYADEWDTSFWGTNDSVSGTESVYYVRKNMPGDLPHTLTNPTINGSAVSGVVSLGYTNPGISSVGEKNVTATAKLPDGSTAQISIPVMVVPKHLKYFWDPGDSGGAGTAFTKIKNLVEQGGWTMANTVPWGGAVSTGANTGWYGVRGSTLNNDVVSARSNDNDLFEGLAYTGTNGDKFGVNMLNLTNGADYSVYVGHWVPSTWGDRSVTLTSSTGAQPGTLSIAGTQGRGSLSVSNSRQIASFTITPEGAGQIRVCVGYNQSIQPCFSFMMVEETRSDTYYSISYNLNNGTLPGDAITQYTASAGAALPAPEKSGYTFGGWYDNAGLTGSAATSIASGSSGNKEYWAKWTSSTSVTVTLTKPGAGVSSYGAPFTSAATSTVERGGAVTFTVAPAEGYKLDGASSTSGSASVSGNTVTVTNITANATITLTLSRLPAITALSANAAALAQGYPARVTLTVAGVSLTAAEGVSFSIGGASAALIAANAAEGSAVIDVPDTLAAGIYPVTVTAGNVIISAGSVSVTVRTLPDDIWNAVIGRNASGYVTLTLADAAVDTSSAEVAYNGAPTEGDWSGRVFTSTQKLLAALANGDEFRIAGVRYTELFPSYAFTITKPYIAVSETSAGITATDGISEEIVSVGGGTAFADGGATKIHQDIDVLARRLQTGLTYYYWFGGYEPRAEAKYTGAANQPVGSYIGSAASGAATEISKASDPTISRYGTKLDTATYKIGVPAPGDWTNDPGQIRLHIAGVDPSGSEIVRYQHTFEYAAAYDLTFSGGAAVFYNRTNETAAGKVFVAVYRAGTDRLARLVSADLNAPALGYQSVDPGVSGSYPLGEYYYAAYAWDDQYAPYTNQIVVR